MTRLDDAWQIADELGKARIHLARAIRAYTASGHQDALLDVYHALVTAGEGADLAAERLGSWIVDHADERDA